VELPFVPLAGRFVRLEPFAPALKEEVREAIDCDPDAWAILPTNPTGERFEAWWAESLAAPTGVSLAYAIRTLSDGRVVGKSTFYTSLTSQGGVEIGSTFLHPDVRSGPVNPETKLLMLGHAFAAGALRVQFKVDTRNQRSQAAVAKLGAVREGVLRKDRLTWTGYVRDTAYFSIVDGEWPAVRARLQQRLDTFARR
jgi:RimJ/RimL family protein N-acetyltransferase